jgi:DNA-binding CsgD family transcriptional regulator
MAQPRKAPRKPLRKVPLDRDQLLLGIHRYLDRMCNALQTIALADLRAAEQSPTEVRPVALELLSEGEKEVVRLIARPDQKTYDALAAELNMTRGVFEHRVARIYEKLDVGNRGGLVLLVTKWGV